MSPAYSSFTGFRARPIRLSEDGSVIARCSSVKQDQRPWWGRFGAPCATLCLSSLRSRPAIRAMSAASNGRRGQSGTPTSAWSSRTWRRPRGTGERRVDSDGPYARAVRGLDRSGHCVVAVYFHNALGDCQVNLSTPAEAPERTPYTLCHLPWVNFTIDFAPRVVGCCGDLRSEHMLGNVLEQPADRVWNG